MHKVPLKARGAPLDVTALDAFCNCISSTSTSTHAVQILGAVCTSIGPAMSRAALSAEGFGTDGSEPSHRVQSSLGHVCLRSFSQAGEGVCPRTHGAEWLGLTVQAALAAVQFVLVAAQLGLTAAQFALTAGRCLCNAALCFGKIMSVSVIALYVGLGAAIGGAMLHDRIRYGPRTNAEVLALMRKAHCKGVASAVPESPRICAACAPCVESSQVC